MTEPDENQDRAKSIFDKLRANRHSRDTNNGSARDIPNAATGTSGGGEDHQAAAHEHAAPPDASWPTAETPAASAPTPTPVTARDDREVFDPGATAPAERPLTAYPPPPPPFPPPPRSGDGWGPAAERPNRGGPPAPAAPPPPPSTRVGVGEEHLPGTSPFAEQIGTELQSIPTLEPVAEVASGLHPGASSHPLPRCLAVANQKGGVGKTTTTVNLGAALAELGYRVLVVDLDPQGNATTGLGVNARNLDSSVYDVILHDVPIEDTIEPTSMRNLFIVPATIDLAGAEIELVPVFSRELRLRRALETVEADFDFVLIDCPPSLGLLTVNALAAAGEVLVPIQCEYYALEGLGQLLRNVNLVQSNLNNRLEVSTIVLTMYDARTKLAEQVAGEVREHFGARVCRNVVPRTVRLSEAPSFGQPVTTFDSSSRGAIAYRELAKEVSGGAPQRIR
ncbi:MAG TPA: AAA family ATPase [Acidimicrobiales bacterium]|nr:AAA family ATPase [Acidimicrobiales bacterium]